MKRVALLLLSLFLVFAISGCGSNDKYAGKWYCVNYDGKTAASLSILNIDNNKENYILTLSGFTYETLGYTLNGEPVLQEKNSDKGNTKVASLNAENGMLEYNEGLRTEKITYVEKDDTLLIEGRVLSRIKDDKHFEEIKHQLFDEIAKTKYSGNAIDIASDQLNKVDDSCAAVEKIMSSHGLNNTRVLATTYTPDKSISLSLTTLKNNPADNLSFTMLDGESVIVLGGLNMKFLYDMAKGTDILRYDMTILDAPRDKDEKTGNWKGNAHHMRFSLRNGLIYEGKKRLPKSSYNGEFKPGMLTTFDIKGHEVPLMEQKYVDYSNALFTEGEILLDKIKEANIYFKPDRYGFAN